MKLMEDTQGYIIKDDFITDYFELIMQEALAEEYSDIEYSLEDFQKEVRACISALESTNYFIDFNSITQWQVLDTTDVTAGVRANGQGTYLFVLSKALFRKRSHDYWKTVIYHELCHILQMQYLFGLDVLYYTDKLYGNLEEREYINSAFVENNHHTFLWWHYVRDVNKRLKVQPPVDQLLTDEQLADIFLEDITNADFGYELPDELIE